jgi:hypothetical protein
MQDETLVAGIDDQYQVTVESGPGSGDLMMSEPAVDLDGDGILDTRVYSDGGGMTIASDLDEDGWADHVARIEADGAYAAWEPQRDPDGTVRWDPVDEGRLSFER